MKISVTVGNLFQHRKFKMQVHLFSLFVQFPPHTLWLWWEWTFKVMFEVPTMDQQPSHEVTSSNDNYRAMQSLAVTATPGKKCQVSWVYWATKPHKVSGFSYVLFLHRDRWDAPLHLRRTAINVSSDRILLVKTGCLMCCILSLRRYLAIHLICKVK